MNKKLLRAMLCALSALTMQTPLESKTQSSILKPPKEAPSSSQLTIKATVTPEEVATLTEQVHKGENLDKAADALLSNILEAGNEQSEIRYPLAYLFVALAQAEGGKDIMINKARSALKSADEMIIAEGLDLYGDLIRHFYANTDLLQEGYQAALKHYESSHKKIQEKAFFVLQVIVAHAEHDTYIKKQTYSEITTIAFQGAQSNNIDSKRNAFKLLANILQVDKQSIQAIEQRALEAIDNENSEIKIMGLELLEVLRELKTKIELGLQQAHTLTQSNNPIEQARGLRFFAQFVEQGHAVDEAFDTAHTLARESDNIEVLTSVVAVCMSLVKANKKIDEFKNLAQEYEQSTSPRDNVMAAGLAALLTFKIAIEHPETKVLDETFVTSVHDQMIRLITQFLSVDPNKLFDKDMDIVKEMQKIEAGGPINWEQARFAVGLLGPGPIVDEAGFPHSKIQPLLPLIKKVIASIDNPQIKETAKESFNRLKQQ